MVDAPASTPPASTPAGDTLVDVEGLGRAYGDTRAVHGLTFTVKRGEVVGFLGHNGAGKSTTMRMLAGALAPTAGRASIAGFTCGSLEARRRVGFLPEQPPLTAELTVEEQLAFAAGLRGVDDRNAIERLIARCDLGEVRKKLTSTLSKGTKQRVGLAQALLGDPPVLLLDEPTAGLDPKQAAAVRALITELAKDHAVLLSTHLLSEVTTLCHRVILVRRGTLALDATLGTLRAHGRSLEETVLRVLDGVDATSAEAA